MPDPQELQQRLRNAIREVIKQQLDTDEPPETRETLARLQRQGYSESEAFELVGRVVTAEVLEVLAQDRKYDARRYVARLNALPGLPAEENETVQ